MTVDERKQYNREYYLRNKERLKEEYDRYKIHSQQYYINNKEKILAYQKQYNKENRVERLEYLTVWKEKNKEL